MKLAGKRVTVWGLGLFGGGAAVTRYLVEAGARVQVIDTKPRETLAPTLAALEGLDVSYHLGAPHRDEDLLGADLVVKSPAIPPTAPWVTRLAEAGVPCTSEIGLALAQVQVPYVAVTGSKGKTTTASLMGAMLAGAGLRVRVAGNNERPLLDALREEPSAEVLVLELSSFMACALADERARGVELPAPAGLVFTRLCPEHLNWHGSLDHYYGSKLSLLDLEPARVVIPGGDEVLEERVPARAASLTRVRTGEPASDEIGVHEGFACEGEQRLFPLDALQLLGAHNRENALLACAGARTLGALPKGIEAGVRGFRALEHRLETVARRGGLSFIDDSTATTPEAAIAALRAAPKPVVLLAGGSDKGADYGALGQVAAAEASTVICLGAVGARIAQAVEDAAGEARVVRVEGGFDDAFRAGLERCGERGSLLLSPAAASYDMFTNFKARGQRFRELSLEAVSL